MSSAAEDAKFLPYVDAVYWDGHMIGSGEQTPNLPPAIGLQPPINVEAVLKKQVAAITSQPSEQSFEPVRVFDASKNRLGTLIMFLEEELSGTAVRPPEAIRSVADVTPTEAQRLRIGFGHQAEKPVFARGKYHVYIRQLMAGIVGPDRQDQRIVYALPAQLINPNPEGPTSVANAGWRNYVGEMRVAETLHGKTQSRERLVRIRGLEVYQG